MKKKVVDPRFARKGEYKEVIDSDEIFLLSALSLFEIRKKLVKNRIDSAKINKTMEFIRKRSLIIGLNPEITEKAVEFSISHNLPAIDSLIYAASIFNNAIMLTLDNDLRGLKDVIILSDK